MLRSIRARWLVAVSLAGALVVGGVAIAARATSSNLPPIQADRLIASTIAALGDPGSVSGEVAVKLDLGIPQLPDTGYGSAGGQLTSLFGDHRVKVWASTDGFRLADLLKTNERDLYVSSDGVWWWDSETFTATHLPLPTGGGGAIHPPGGDDPFDPLAPMAGMFDPLELTRRLLEGLDPSTSVSAEPGPPVAGRDAYLLTLRPRTTATLIGRVEIGIDAQSRLPLRVAVFGRQGGSAPVSLAFTRISFDRIDPATFGFTPPPGAVVHDGPGGAERPGPGPSLFERFPPEVRSFGEGWATIAAVQVSSTALSASAPSSFDYRQLLPFSGPLFSVRLEDRGDHAWLVYGAVPQAALAEVAPRLL